MPKGNVDLFGLRKISKKMWGNGDGSRMLGISIGLSIIILFLALISIAPQIGEKYGDFTVRKAKQESLAAGTYVAGSSQYPTINSAISAAGADDIVEVKAGTYSEQVNINKSLTLRPSGNDIVWIDGNCSRDHNIVVDASDVTIEGIGMKKSNESGVVLSGADNVTIDGVTIHDYNCANGDDQYRAGIASWYGGRNLTVKNSTINRRVELSGSEVGQGNGIWVKNTGSSAGGGHYFGYNTIIGAFDGIGGEPEDVSWGSFNKDTVIEFNTVTDCDDDGIQSEGGNQNNIIRFNTVKRCLIGIGFTPAKTGPLTVYRNVISEPIERRGLGAAMFKMGDGSTADVYVYHNSFFAGNVTADGAKQTNSGMEKVNFRNNAIYSSRYVFETTSHTGAVSSNYDAMNTTDSGRFVKWNGSTYGSLSSFTSNTGQGQNSISPSNFGWDEGTLKLNANSPLIDKGVVIPGINDNYIGSAPDIGAFEFGDDSGGPPPTPSPIPSPSPVPSPSPAPSPIPSPSPVFSPSPLLSPSPTILPSPSPTPTQVASPSPTPTPSPSPVESPIPQAECELIAANWSTNQALEGDTVGLSVSSNGECQGETVRFIVKENDSIIEGMGDDDVAFNPVDVTFNTISTNTTWVAEWQDDCNGLCPPPEYYFDAELASDNNKKLRSADPMLNVEKKTTGEIPSDPSPLPGTNLVFEDSFENGNTGSWTDTVVDGGNSLEVRQASAYKDGFGLNVSTIEGQDDARVIKQLAPNEHIFARLMVKLNSNLTQTSFPQSILHVGSDRGDEDDGADIGIQQESGDFNNNLFTWNGANNDWQDTGLNLGRENWYCMELEYRTGSSGLIRLWVDGELVTERLNISTSGNPVSWIVLGANGAGAAANYDIDTFTAAKSRIGCSSADEITDERSLAFEPIDDTFVNSRRADRNFGRQNQLKVDGRPDKDILMRFAVSGVEGSLALNAKLRLFVTDSSPDAGLIYRITSKNWSETDVTWNNAPQAENTPIGSIGKVSSGQWIEADVSSLIQGDGNYSLKIRADHRNGANFASRESDNSPQLIITLK